MPAFAEPADVQRVLQKTDAKFGDKQLSSDIVEAAIRGASDWFWRQTDAYFYDSNAADSDLIDTSAETVTGIIESVGESPHRQDTQVFHSRRGAGQPKYPNTIDGQHVKVQLPARYVQSIDALKVRETGGDVTDWVAASDKQEGRGEDYYLQVDGSDGYGRSYLYINADSIGARRSFQDLLTIDVSYGIDQQNQSWQDVRRGIAAIAGAQVVAEDDVIAQLPDNGSLIGANTQVQNLLSIAFEEPGALNPYMGAPVA